MFIVCFRGEFNGPRDKANSRVNGDVNHNLPGHWSGDEGELDGKNQDADSFFRNPVITIVLCFLLFAAFL